MFGELGVGAKIDVVIRMEDSGGSLEFEAGHHQFHKMRRKWGWQRDSEMLLDQSGPCQTDVAMAVMRFSVYGSALLDGFSYNVAHLFGVDWREWMDGGIGLLFGIPGHSPPLSLEFLASGTGEVGHHRMVIAGASATFHKLMAHSQDVIDPLLSFINKPKAFHINKIH